MEEKRKICPFMSFAHEDNPPDSPIIAECLGRQFQLWITVYTTEGRQVSDCAKALEPAMTSGQLRV